METRYPIRKADGKDFAGPDEILALLRNERHGQWLAGNNGMWHGGIHISRESAPLAVISAESAEGAVPLQCIAQGEIVAWRLQQDYHQQPYGEAAEGEEAINLKYSSAFVLVRSVHKPDENPATWLTFYTLYMHLAPLSCFPKMVVYEVTPEGDGLSKRRYSGTETSGQVAPHSFGALSAGQKVIVEQEMMFLVPQRHRGRDGQRLPDVPFQFGLARNIKDGAPSGEKFWTSVMPQFVAPAGEKYAYLPDWMDKAVQNGTMDAVVVPPQPIAIRAGDAIGFLAQDDAPVTGGAVQSDWFMHIEVLSNDANMPAFLSNPGHLTKGTLYIEVQGGQPLYRCEERDGKKILTPLENTSDAEAGKLLRRDDAKPWKDEAGISWYLIKPETWIKQDGIKEIIQHDLKALRFTPLEQEPAKDFQQSLGEQWLGKAFSFIGGAIHPERALESQELSEYYSQIAKVLDANGDGKISSTELDLYRSAVLQGLRNRNEEVEMLLRRIIVKHESEWYGKSSHPRWQTLLDTLPKAGQDYAKIWIDNHEWMSQVPALAKDEAVWHFHPVEFLPILESNKCDCEEIYGDKFTVTRYGKVYGPIHRGNISLKSYSRWDILVAEGKITLDEKQILIAMSENEGNMDAIQSYDSEVITAGAMQKTVKDTYKPDSIPPRDFRGKGEFSTQFAKFRDLYPEQYNRFAISCGWSVEGTGSSATLYYSDADLTNGKKITELDLKKLIRKGCDISTYGKVVHNKPLAALLKVITLPEYLDIQVLDFIDRLHDAESIKITSTTMIKSYIKSKFGRAIVLDHSVNRPGLVKKNFKSAIDNFYAHNPGINRNPDMWGIDFDANEKKLLEEYKLTRDMTDALNRFNSLKGKL